MFKPVRALSIRTHYQTLTVRVASAERTEEVLGRLGDAWPEECVLELIGADATSDHIVCMAVGCHEDEGENWEPSAFAADLSDAPRHDGARGSSAAARTASCPHASPRWTSSWPRWTLPGPPAAAWDGTCSW